MVMTDNLRGALLMTGSMTAFTVNDAFMKLLSEDLPFFQLLFVRSVAVAVLIGVMAWRANAFARRLSPQDKKLVAIRSLAEIGAAYFFLNALFNLPIANVTAILQALPLTVALGAALVLREHVGWRRFLAIGIGFGGVLLIVRPTGDGFTLYSVYALLSVVCVTVRDLAARKLSRDVPSLLVALAAVLGVLAFSVVGAAFVEWQPMDGRDSVLMVFAVLAIIGGYLFSVMAMRVGEIGAVAPFRYTSLLAALVIGLLVFGEWPDMLTQIGALIVVATGLFTLWRERNTARKAPPGLRVR
jgi:S-adenosylmethionine uptake transporter